MDRSSRAVLVALIAMLGACAGNPTSTGRVTHDAGPDALPSCAERAKWVYLIDIDGELLRFNPRSHAFTWVGTVDCPSGGEHPFSMSVDREARAWVLHRDGLIYGVSTQDASCEPTAFSPGQEGFDLFGMGFTSDGVEAETETLFVAGGSDEAFDRRQARLGSVDDETLVITPLDPLPGWPELTGTGEGDLWGFFPNTSPPSIRGLSKHGGDATVTHDLDALGALDPIAWAFAFWGGHFYLFLQEADDASSHVWRFDPESGELGIVVRDSGYRIVGAGVSTCAPVDLI